MTQPLPTTGEAILAALRTLYGGRGYAHYKMNKFEEYDLYAHHKDFLISDSVITFMDGNGKLLALKPDVTLSIVKNSKDDPDAAKKLYYHENVYRMTKDSRNFKEIMQVGLECIGRVDAFCVYEVLSLALDSLAAISPDHVLSVSDLGLLTALLDASGVPAEKRAALLHYIGEKNLHELTAALAAIGVDGEACERIRQVAAIGGKAADVMPRLRELLSGVVDDGVFARFESILGAFGDRSDLQIDFSVVGDLRYYNGFVFKGFIEGIPMSVLSGGQYDLLMRKMNKNSGAIGFAVYLDTVEQYLRRNEQYDVDVLLLYDETSSLPQIADAVGRLTAAGKSVLTDTVLPEGIHYRELIRLRGGKAVE